MERSTAILATLVAYKLVLVGIGLWARSATRTEAEFYLAGRRLGPVVAALSASASASSAWALLGVSSAAYAWGLGAVWIMPSVVAGHAFNWFVLAPGIRRSEYARGAITVTDVLSGPRSRPGARAIAALAAVIIVVSFAAYVAAQFQAAGKTFAHTFAIDLDQAILIGAAVVLFYTMLGGFLAVSVSDTLQGLTMGFAAVVIPLVGLIEVGGPGALWDGMTAQGSAFASATRGAEGPAAIGFVVGTLGIGVPTSGQPHIVNRFMALRDDPRALATARVVAISWIALVFAGMLVVGWCGRLLHPQLADAEGVFIAMTHGLFSPIASGVLLAAVLSAIMSTADSQLLVAASAVTHDLGLGGDDPRSRVVRSRLVVGAISVAATVVAIVGTKEIFSSVLFAWTAVGSAFGPLLLVTVLSGRVPARASLLAIAAGFAPAVAAYLHPATQGTVVERIAPFALSLAVAATARYVHVRGRRHA